MAASKTQKDARFIDANSWSGLNVASTLFLFVELFNECGWGRDGDAAGFLKTTVGGEYPTHAQTTRMKWGHTALRRLKNKCKGKQLQILRYALDDNACFKFVVSHSSRNGTTRRMGHRSCLVRRNNSLCFRASLGSGGRGRRCGNLRLPTLHRRELLQRRGCGDRVTSVRRAWLRPCRRR